MVFLCTGSIIFACHKIAPGVNSGEIYDPQLRGSQYTSFNAAPNQYGSHSQDVSAAAYDLHYLGTHQAHPQSYPTQWMDRNAQQPSQPWAYNDPSLSADSRSKALNGHSFRPTGPIQDFLMQSRVLDRVLTISNCGFIFSGFCSPGIKPLLSISYVYLFAIFSQNTLEGI